jgi:hypothetical protein
LILPLQPCMLRLHESFYDVPKSKLRQMVAYILEVMIKVFSQLCYGVGRLLFLG